MPKNLNKSCPVKAKAIIVIKAATEDFLAVLFLSLTDNSEVMDIKTGIVPRGLISVNKEVKHKSAKDTVSVILFWLSGLIYPEYGCPSDLLRMQVK